MDIYFWQGEPVRAILANYRRTKNLFKSIWHFPLVLVFGMSSLTAIPIIFSPLTADDIPNSKLRMFLSSLEGNLFQNWVISIWNGIFQWLEAEGRFFPGAVLYGHIIHFIFQGQGLYKFYLALICFAIASQIYYLLSFVFSQNTALFGTLFFLSTYSIRYVYFHDGITSFAGMVPFALFCYLSALNLALRSKQLHSTKLYLSILLYLFSSLIYEHFAILLLGTFVFLHYLKPIPKSIRFLFFGLSSLQILFAMYLKVGQNSAPAYSLNLSPFSVIKTTYVQFIGALPGSQFWATNHFISESLLMRIENTFFLIVFVSIISWVIFRHILERNNFNVLNKRHVFSYVFLGANLALLPALLTGMTLQWQSAIPVGEAYLCVTIQSAGLSILFAVVFDQISRVRLTFGRFLFLVLFGFYYLNLVWNYFFIQQ
jgi:hypothetical protein